MMLKTKIICFILLMISVSSVIIGADEEIPSKFCANGEVEYGIDSLERRCLSPRFRFDYFSDTVLFFLDVTYLQSMGGKLEGEVDFWIMLGLEKKINKSNKIEFRLNHICRHLTSRENPDFFDLNEIVSKVWFTNKHFRVGVGGGIFSGATAGYKYLFTLNVQFNQILGSEISFKGEFKLVDCSYFLHETEIFFELNQSTDLFIRNSRYYESDNRTYIGIRMKSKGKIERYMDSIKLLTGILPWYEKHKLLLYGQFRLILFWKTQRRIIVSADVIAPILRGAYFLGDFFPEKITYPILLEYERKIGDSMFIVWYGRYVLNMPMDIEHEFDASLGTGLTLRNQRDFDMVKKAVRYELSVGYNFKHNLELGAKFGFILLKDNSIRIGSGFRITLNDEKFLANLKLFVDCGNSTSFRPFIGFERVKYYNSPEPAENKFMFGLGFYKWFGKDI